jgi:hypothetical protein
MRKIENRIGSIERRGETSRAGQFEQAKRRRAQEFETDLAIENKRVAKRSEFLYSINVKSSFFSI